MILSSEEAVSYSHDQFAVRHKDMHPVLQGYSNRFTDHARHTLGRLIRHAQYGEIGFVKRFLSDYSSDTEYWGVPFDPCKLADDIIEYCDIKITENDIEYYLPHCGCD